MTKRCHKIGLQSILTNRRDLGLDDRVLVHHDSFKTNPTYNTDGLINCLRQPGQPHYQHPKFMVFYLFKLIKSCCTRTHPAAETESIGLPADAQLSWFLQSHLDSFTVTRDSQPSIGTLPSGQLYLDQKAHAHLPGLCKNSCQRVPRSATKLNRRAVSVNSKIFCTLDNFKKTNTNRKISFNETNFSYLPGLIT